MFRVLNTDVAYDGPDKALMWNRYMYGKVKTLYGNDIDANFAQILDMRKMLNENFVLVFA